MADFNTFIQLLNNGGWKPSRTNKDTKACDSRINQLLPNKADKNNTDTIGNFCKMLDGFLADGTLIFFLILKNLKAIF